MMYYEIRINGALIDETGHDPESVEAIKFTNKFMSLRQNNPNNDVKLLKITVEEVNI